LTRSCNESIGSAHNPATPGMREPHTMNLGPTGDVRPNCRKTAPERTQHAIFEPRRRPPSPRGAGLSRDGFSHDVIEHTHLLQPASDGRCGFSLASGLSSRQILCSINVN
jgi:hypothetical protein